MKSLIKPQAKPALILKQRGVVLFFALIALLAMSLAAVALIRSVDTNTMIASNLAFKQSATSSGDAGVEFAVNWIQAIAAQNKALNILPSDPANPFNIDQPALGYYSSAASSVSLTDDTGIQWTDTDSVAVPSDDTNNKTRVVIQRMCNTPGVPPGPDNCLRGITITGGGQQDILLATETERPDSTIDSYQFRITARSEAPRSSTSYVQAFAF
jgi:Tfp pilus assembly protein PilX